MFLSTLPAAIHVMSMCCCTAVPHPRANCTYRDAAVAMIYALHSLSPHAPLTSPSGSACQVQPRLPTCFAVAHSPPSRLPSDSSVVFRQRSSSFSV